MNTFDKVVGKVIALFQEGVLVFQVRVSKDDFEALKCGGAFKSPAEMKVTSHGSTRTFEAGSWLLMTPSGFVSVVSE